MPIANAFRPIGFIPIDYAGKVSSIRVVRPVPTTRTVNTGGSATTDMAIGDAYAIDTSGNAYRAGPLDVVRGIIVGFVLTPNQTVMNAAGPVSLDYVTGVLSNAILLVGSEDPQAEFAVQADTFAATQLGLRVNLLDTTVPDSTFRQSRQSVNVGGAPGLQFQIIDIVGGPGTSPLSSGLTMGSPNNAYGANALVKVRLLQTYNN